MSKNRSNLGKILRQRRLLMPLTFQELAAKSGISASHLSRIERGERFPSAHILRKMAEALGFNEAELFTRAGYLSPQASTTKDKTQHLLQLDPDVARLLASEPAEVQRTVIGILTILKSIAKGSGCNIGFAEYSHRNYPESID